MTDSHTRPAIGFIGLGYMGRGMAANLLRAGYPLWVRGNRNRTPVEALVGAGAQEADSPAAMAQVCDVIHLCLSNSDQVEAVVTGKDGLVAGLRPGLTVLDCSTSDPASTDRLARILAEAGGTLVDAPLGRTPKEAKDGTLDAMVGASDHDFARLRPIVECWAGTITHTGPVGSAHRMKLVMNFIALGFGGLLAEAITLGTRAGISPQTIRAVMESSRINNGFMETFMRYAVDRDPDAHKFSITNARKDLGYGARMAADADVSTPMGAAALAYLTQAVAQGQGDRYVPMLSDFVARQNGLDLGAAVEAGDG